MSKHLITAAIAILLIIALVTPVFAQITHTALYDVDGTIDFEKQAGHKCNTGAEITQTIYGNGVMDKSQSIFMVEGKITMEDDNNWIAGATPLTVTTVWDLCAPAKYVFTDDWDAFLATQGIDSILDEYFSDDTVALMKSLKSGDPVPPYLGYLFNWETNLLNIFRSFGIEGVLPNLEIASPLTDQIWAVQVQANPGFSGNLYQNGTAAYGPHYSQEILENRVIDLDEPDYTTWIDSKLGDYSDGWRYEYDEDGNIVIGIGKNFVGNYFDMEQHARTSQGTLRRYISISSPFNHGYLMENMSVVGKSDVQETYSMQNLPAGSDIIGQWWNLF